MYGFESEKLGIVFDFSRYPLWPWKNGSAELVWICDQHLFLECFSQSETTAVHTENPKVINGSFWTSELINYASIPD